MKDLHDGGRIVLALKGTTPSERFEKDDAQGEEIRPTVQVLGAELLGRHVRHFALDRALLARGPGDGFGHTEVGEQDLPAAAYHDIRG